MSVTVDLAIEDPSWTALSDLQSLADRAVAAALAEAGAALPAGTELSCLFCDDAAIRALNRDWRGLDTPTNVLSFPASGPAADRLLGDIALSYGTVAREAEDEGKPIENHVAHLIIHGTLHLIGHDHTTTADAEAMESVEIRALGRLGLPDPYEGTVPDLRPASPHGSGS